MRRALITGITGFVGSELARHLLSSGIEVVGISRRLPAAIPIERRVPEAWLVQGHVTDLALITRTMAEYEPDAVFHLAGGAARGTASDDALGAFELETRGTWIVLEAARRTRAPRAVVLLMPIEAEFEHATSVLCSSGPALAAKTCAAAIARTYVSTYGLPVGIARVGHVFGARDRNPEHLLAGTVLEELAGRPPVPAHPSSPDTHVHVADLCDGLVRIADRLGEGPIDSVVLAARERCAPSEVQSFVVARLRGESRELETAAPAEEAAPPLGWRPAQSLPDALRATVDEYRSSMRSTASAASSVDRAGHWKGASVLVTGGRGFIGRHLVERLRSEGAAVLVAPDGPEFHDPAWLENARPHFVFHLGASVDLAPDAEARRTNVRVNLSGTLRLLEACLEAGTQAFVFTSSSAVYGRGSVPFDEDQPLRPNSSYALSKLGAEELCRTFHGLGLSTRVVRLSTVYGPGQSERRLVPAIVLACLRGERLEMGDPQQRRDFVFVSDVVDGLLAAALSDEASGQAINLGQENTIAVRELVDAVRERIGPCPEPHYGAFPARSGEARLWASSSRKAARILRWRPRTSLGEGLDATIAHYQALVLSRAGGDAK